MKCPCEPIIHKQLFSLSEFDKSALSCWGKWRREETPFLISALWGSVTLSFNLAYVFFCFVLICKICLYARSRDWWPHREWWVLRMVRVGVKWSTTIDHRWSIWTFLILNLEMKINCVGFFSDSVFVFYILQADCCVTALKSYAPLEINLNNSDSRVGHCPKQTVRGSSCFLLHCIETKRWRVFRLVISKLSPQNWGYNIFYQILFSMCNEVISVTNTVFIYILFVSLFVSLCRSIDLLQPSKSR